MRLTLRTLLAYMDDILDPTDQEELGRKIEASAFATELIHRSRDAVRRLRLSAPEVMAGDSGEVLESDHNLDANTAAEYLDNTLSPEDVAEFERSCLEAGPNADMLLAEASSCHHVLTLVLGEPAEVDADLRQRMYALVQDEEGSHLRIEGAHQSPRQVAASAPAQVFDRRPQIDADEAAVPDYILEAARSRRRKQRLVMAGIAAAILCGAFTWFAWPANPELPKEIAELGNPDDLAKGVAVGDGAETASPDDGQADAAPTDEGGGEAPAWSAGASNSKADLEEPSTGDTDAPSTPSTEPAATETDSGKPDPAAGDSAAMDGPAADDAAAMSLAGPQLGSPQSPVGPGSDVADPRTPLTPPSTPPQDNVQTANADAAPGTVPPAPPAPPAEAGEGSATASSTTGSTPISPAPMVPGVGEEASSLPAVEPAAEDEGVAGADAATPTNFDSDPGDAAEAAPKPIGSYLGNNDMLLRFDPAANAWVRLPPLSTLTPGDVLLSLPTFRTHVSIADANAHLCGGTEIEVGAPIPAADGTPVDVSIRLPYGRLVLNAGLNGNLIALNIADQVHLVALHPSASLAVEVQRELLPGSNPQTEPPPLKVNWYLASGSAVLGDAVDSAKVEAPAMWKSEDGVEQAPQALDELPDWINAERITEVEGRGHKAMADALAVGQPVDIRLAELGDENSRGRRVEDRALAARAGAYVNEFSALVKALSDVTQKSSWKTVIQSLRQAIARDPAAIVAIHEEFSVQLGKEAADDLMELLLGFDSRAIGATRTEVQNGVLNRLIRWLVSDDLTYRVLAIHNINEITGTSGLGGYRPEHNARQRERETKYFWDRLERGELMPRPKP